MICVGTGNNGNDSVHTAGILETGMQAEIPFSVSPREPVLNVQLWKSYADEIEILSLIHIWKDTDDVQDSEGFKS